MFNAHVKASPPPDLPSAHAIARSRLSTRWGPAEIAVFRVGEEEIATLTFGLPEEGQEALVRVHSQCFTSESFGSPRCDCREQLDAAAMQMGRAGQGVLIYTFDEGRGIGLVAKVRAYSLQERGIDTIDANLLLGLPVDRRRFEPAAAVLRALGLHRLALLTNNPEKVTALQRAGFQVRQEALRMPAHDDNIQYLKTKQERMGHDLGLELSSPLRDVHG